MAVELLKVKASDGTLIPVWKSGTGRPLVLVHGAAGGHEVWDAVRPYLESSVTVLAMDRRSRLMDPSFRYDLRHEFEDLAAVSQAIGGEVDILGQSSGAICALGASLITGELRRLLLYEPPFIDRQRRLTSLSKLEALLAAGDLEGIAETSFREVMGLSESAIREMKASPGWQQGVREAPFLVRELAVLSTWSPDPEVFRAVKAPTLFLVGSETPVSHHHRGYIKLLRPVLDSLVITEIPGEEHRAHRSSPELFAKLVLEFLEANC